MLFVGHFLPENLHGCANDVVNIAVIDWEFAGTYPLGELLEGGSVSLIELESDEDFTENHKWGQKIRDYVEEKAEARNWSEKDVDNLFKANRALQNARIEMHPGHTGGYSEPPVDSDSEDSVVHSAEGSPKCEPTILPIRTSVTPSTGSAAASPVDLDKPLPALPLASPPLVKEEPASASAAGDASPIQPNLLQRALQKLPGVTSTTKPS